MDKILIRLEILLLIFLPVTLSGIQAQTFTWGNVKFQGMGFVTGINAHHADPDFVVARTDVGGNYRWDPYNKSWIPLLDSFNAPGVSGDAMSLWESEAVHPVSQNW
jgi:hypothetical protein